MHTRVLRIIAKLLKLLREANIFKRYPSNDRQIRYQRYATQLYIYLLGVSVTVLAVYTLLSESTYRETVFNPAESEYLRLEQAYPSTLSCPCTSIVMPYSTFISIEPHYHQLCSSDLVSAQWIRYTYSAYHAILYILDYRVHAARQFQTLAMLCEQARQTINDGMQNFLQTPWVSAQVMREQLFQVQIDSHFRQWNLSTVNQYTQTIEFILVTNQANQLMNRLNIFFYSDRDPALPTVGPRTYNECNCAFSAACHTSMKIFNTATDYSAPNFFVGCFLIEALLSSTLECFYDQTCMLELDRYLNFSLRQALHFPALNASLSSPSETVRSLVNRLMVDSWSWNVYFSRYYNACTPYLCTFEYRSRNGFVNAITTIVGVFGGLSIGFRTLILVGLRLVEKVRQRPCFTVSVRSIGRLLSGVNEQQRIHRLHLVLVAVALSVLYALCAFTPRLVTVETKEPSLNVYQDLSERFPDSLHCSCSQISISYGRFLDVTAAFHPACLRNFVSEFWSVYYSSQSELYKNITLEYAYSAGGQLLALASLCKLSERIVSNAILQLLSSVFINTEILSSQVLDTRIQTVIDTFTIALSTEVVGLLSLIREITAANMMMTTFSSNWKFASQSNPADNQKVYTVPVQFPDCDCGLSSQCMKQTSGVSIGCYILEALLQSTFECLYDQECADRTHTYQALNTALNPSRFSINSTFESVFTELMIEALTHEISYKNYFAQCESSACIHSHIEQSNLLEGITTLISLYGGLVVICRLLALIIFKLLRRCVRKGHPTTI